MLNIIDLHVRIKEKNILRGINLKIQKGEIHAIMGPNGSGKSTLSSIIAGKEGSEVTHGSIFFEGKNILKYSPEKRAHLGIFLSFQYPIEIPGVSITNFIRTAINSIRKAKGLEEITATDMLKKIHQNSTLLGIDKNLLYRSINEGFSGGEKKLTEIFQMAMLEPKLAILDETDSGLDIDALRIVANGIKSLKKRENAILIITHYHRILQYIVPDYVHVLYQGKIVKSGDKKLTMELEKKGYDWIKTH